MPRRLRVRMPGNKVQKMAGVLGSDDLADLHLRLASHFQHPDRLVVGGTVVFTGLPLLIGMLKQKSWRPISPSETLAAHAD